jgi:sortase A
MVIPAAVIPPVPALPTADSDATAIIEKVKAPARGDGKLYSSKSWFVRERRKRSGGPVRTTIRVIGEVLIACGLVVLLFAVYEVYGKTADINNHQNQLEQQLEQNWGGTPPATSAKPGNIPASPPGGAVARLYIPKLKKHWVVVEGVTLHDIRYAPGHYPGTALPGQIGNFAVAGHRVPAIFWDLDKIHKNDTLIVETADYWYVYQVTVNEIVTPHSVEVIAPDPDKPGVKPTQAMMTLTTCNPKWDNYQRMVVHARLMSPPTPHADGPPVPLGS